jgi:hypothetical protein
MPFGELKRGVESYGCRLKHGRCIRGYFLFRSCGVLEQGGAAEWAGSKGVEKWWWKLERVFIVKGIVDRICNAPLGNWD